MELNDLAEFVDRLDTAIVAIQLREEDRDERIHKNEEDIQDILAKFESRISALEHNVEILRRFTRWT